ncbi:hypothetical protein WJX72_003113 [[Myrmecia] bisecta]|uniref:Serine/threonine-protein phosphatase 2A activator n=1 Tax=[Myrmecia] bisecta TaxID=41462 RepID=A0AAW1R5C0_9CHLO
MAPTAAPWAQAGQAGAPLARRPPGTPVEEIIHAEPHMPGAVPSPQLQPGVVPRPAQRRIHSQEDLAKFLKSQAIKDFVGFILALNDSVRGAKLSADCPTSAATTALVDVLDTLWGWVDEVPPRQQSLRYGNPAYRDWFARVADHAVELLQRVLPPDLAPMAAELAPYLTDSFGNVTRIDYGTGHETTFVALLFCLARLGLLTERDRQALVLRVYHRYLRLMRRVQTTYWLEPAGSHGVWGLDDYQFMPFIWGSAQLIDNPFIRPKSIHSHDVLEGYASEYLYLGCVRFVKQVKKGPLAETSPMLNDISGIATWSKVNSGMMKMYQAEVLAKFPIMQHFLFCSLLPFDDA